MERYKVRITDAALQDMEDIYIYIAEKLQAPGNARGQYNRIADAILSLSAFPERYRLLEPQPWRSVGMRRMNVDNYSVFYVLRGETAYVTDVLYSASDIESRLRGLKQTEENMIE